jgi:hypothetical protein
MANCVWLRRGKVQRIEWEELSSASSKQSSMRISDEIRWDEFYMPTSGTAAYENGSRLSEAVDVCGRQP